jgi:multisubunit Na+/H+ antiporter MnhB subunit
MGLRFLLSDGHHLLPTHKLLLRSTICLYSHTPHSSFIIQLAGALMTTGNNASQSVTGLHVYTAGVALQECVILGFFGLSIFSFRRFKNLHTDKDKRKGVRLMIVLYTSLILISISFDPLTNFNFYTHMLLLYIYESTHHPNFEVNSGA